MDKDVAKKIADFFGQYRLQYADKGHILIHAGHDPEGIFYLVGGQVRQYDISPNGDEVVVNVFKPPAFFPMSWAINRTHNEYYYEAYTKVMFRRAPADDAVAFLRENADVAFDLLSRVYRGMDGLLARMVLIMENSAKNRLLFELLLSAERFGKPHGDKSVALNMSEGELAARVGLSRETVSREMRALKTQGFVSVTTTGITVEDVEALRTELRAKH